MGPFLLRLAHAVTDLPPCVPLSVGGVNGQQWYGSQNSRNNYGGGGGGGYPPSAVGSASSQGHASARYGPR